MVNSLYLYDIVFLVLFVLATAIFLYRKRSNLRKEGLLYLYPTQIGVRYIDHFASKHQRWLRPLQYVILVSGYTLMILITYALVKLAFAYLTSPTLAGDLKVPVIMPLIPYLPELFNIDFLPPFYFTYWIIIIAIIAIPHEFAHGIFARLNGIKVHSTGFGFLGPFLAAFVEPDEKQMQKKPKFQQLSILAAGTFANVLMTILFLGVIWIFFVLSYSPAGVYVQPYVPVQLSINDSVFNASSNSSNFVYLTNQGKQYVTTNEALNYSLENNLSVFMAYEMTPAFVANISGVVLKIDEAKINSYAALKEAIQSHIPGDTISVEFNNGTSIVKSDVVLAERNGSAFLGVGLIDYSFVKERLQERGLLSRISIQLYSIFDPVSYNQMATGVHYESNLGDFGTFIYHLLWWVILINISVALMNMLPLGIFDGGRFFLLTVWGITGSKKAGAIAYKLSTWFFLLLVAAFMVKWFLVIFL